MESGPFSKALANAMWIAGIQSGAILPRFASNSQRTLHTGVSEAMKAIGIFGSTGSIGRNALRIAEAHPDRFAVSVLGAGSNAKALAEQARIFRPDVLVMGNESALPALKEALGPEAWEFTLLCGPDGLAEAAAIPALDVVVNGVTGAQGLPVSLAALQAGTRLGLANKESMVMAGPLLRQMAQDNNAEIIPIDSEHSALFQCLLTGKREDVERLILTASGGPFRELDASEFANVTIEDALKHPTWDMGPKITIDSATMMNKALEIVEARWLFDVSADRIEVAVHPQSIVHSMVLWKDGNVISQMGIPDMRVPIQYALTHPDRLDATVTTWSPSAFNGLNFYEPDTSRFTSLTLGFLAAERGGTYGAVLNAANEEAVEAFFKKRINFQDIFDRVAQVVERHEPIECPTLDEILSHDHWAREEFAKC